MATDRPYRENPAKPMANQINPVNFQAAPRRTLALAAVSAAIVVFLALPATAQSLIGKRTMPSVIVDLSVLDELGPQRNLPQLLMPTLPGAVQPGRFKRTLSAPGAASGRIVLKRPSSLKNKRKRRSKARRRTPRKAATARVAKPARTAPVAVAKLPPPPKIAPPKIAPAPIIKTAPKVKTAPKTKPAGLKKPVRAPSLPAPPPPRTETVPPRPPTIARPSAQAIKPPPAPVMAKPKPVAKPKPRTQTAALPPSAPKIAPGRSLLLLFESGSAKLKRETSRKLKSVAQAMAKDEKLRLQLLAYASGSSQSASRARRLSLSRALAARSYLIGQGVRSTRIDVRALGNKTEGGPPDRIDVIVSRR